MNERNDKGPFFIDILSLQPSQLYINYDKFQKVNNSENINNYQNLEPLPIKRLNDKIILTDGHTRALSYYLSGLKQIPVVWDEPWGSEYLDYEMYRICVDWCIEEGIVSIKNLENRIISDEEYEKLWLNRCTELANSLNKL